MNYKLKGRTLLNGDMISPEISYAQFNAELHIETAKTLVNTLNNGHKMIMAYRQHRDNMHITNVVALLEKLESIYKEYEYREYEIRQTRKLK